MKIETDMTKDDYKKLRRYVFFNYRKTYIYYIAAFLIIILFGWPREESATVVEVILYVLSTIILYLSIFAIFLAISSLVRKLSKNELQPILGNHTFELQEDAFIEQNTIGKSKTDYANFNHIGNTKDHLFLFVTNGSAFLIPKRAFPNQIQEKDFLAQLTQKINATRPTKPQ